MAEDEDNRKGAGMSNATLFGDNAGLFVASARRLVRQRRRARLRLRRRMWIRDAIEAWREVRRSRLAAITAGVWLAWALVRAWELMQ